MSGNLSLRAASQLNIISAYQEIENSDGEKDDEDENFEKGQKTQRQDDLENYTRMLKLQVIHSLTMILGNLQEILSSYEQATQQGQLKAVKICESQLEYLIRLFNALTSQGMPSCVQKFSEQE